MHKKITAFSLIELSIVILIIGILIAGVTQSSRLIKSMNVNSARTQTMSSPVASIKDIVGWWESTLEESFGGSDPEEDLNGDTGGISTWYDINPQNTSHNNATSPATTNNPGYSFNGPDNINGLPTLQFNGVDHYLSFNGTAIANSDYSIFIVEQRTGAFGMGFMVASSSSSSLSNELLQVGYRDDTNITWGQFSNDYNITVSAYSSPIPRIHALTFSSSASTPKTYRINGTTQTLINSYGTAVANQGLTSYSNATFGMYGPENNYYKGNIGEIIIFNRALKSEERRSIEEYLSKKWKIKIS